MRYILFTIILMCVCVSVVPRFGHAQMAQDGIAVIVNDDLISLAELNDRYYLTLVSSRLKDSQQTRARLLPQILSVLVDEQLKFQEAERNEVTASDEEIEQGFAQIAQQNNIPPDQFKQALQKNGVNVATMERQIRAQVLWSKVVARRLRSRVNISENDIDNVVDRLHSNIGTVEYLVSEIYLPLENSTQQADVLGFAQNLAVQIRTNRAPFARMARQFSRSAGGPQGGDLGWTPAGQLPRELDAVLQGMDVGQVSDPILSIGGYYILNLRDKREISEDTMPSRDQVKYNLTIQRLERLQQRHLMDLKTAAFIENRLGS